MKHINLIYCKMRSMRLKKRIDSQRRQEVELADQAREKMKVLFSGFDVKYLDEKVYLIHCAREVIRDRSKINYCDHANYFQKSVETVSRFLNRFYNLPPVDQEFVDFTGDLGEPEFAEYLKRKQERAHLL